MPEDDGSDNALGNLVSSGNDDIVSGYIASLPESIAAVAERDPRVREALGSAGLRNSVPFDPQLAYAGDTDINDAYLEYAAANGATDEELADLRDRDHWRGLGEDLAEWEQWAIPALAGAGSWFNDVGTAAGRGLHANERDRSTTPYVDMSDLSLNPFEHMVDAAGYIPETAATVLDDGSSYDYQHMASNWMTGTQYMDYVEMGSGGLPIEEIDPFGVYNKRYEMQNNGFRPFTPDSQTAFNMAAENVLTAPGRMATTASYARDFITPDYTITYGPDRRTIGGRDFERRAGIYINQLNRSNRMDPYSLITQPDDMDGVTPIVREYAVPNGSGGVSYAHGMLTSASYDDENMYLTFTDGGTIAVPMSLAPSIIDDKGQISLDTSMVAVDRAHGELPDNLSILNDMDRIASLTEGGISPLYYAGVQYIPDMKLDDGTYMPYVDVERLYYDREIGDNPDNAGDNDIEYGFSPGAFNVPRRLQQQELLSDEGWNSDFFGGGNALRNTFDWTAGSIPISFEILQPWLTSGSNALMAMRGVNSGSYNPYTHSYHLNAGYLDDNGNLRYGVTDRYGNVNDRQSAESILWNTAGTALVPATEHIAGSIGSSPIERALTRAGLYPTLGDNPTVRRILANALAGSAGEGVEEIIGNYFDDLSTYGPTGFYANQVYDQYGNPMYDITGREIRDYDTPVNERLSNAMNPADAVNAFAGGVGVSMMMGGLPMAGRMVNAAQRNSAIASAGNGTQVTPSRIQPVSLEAVEAAASAYDNIANGRPVDYREDEEDNVEYTSGPDEDVPEGM
ncbi:MAG: hypothetical protein K5859_03515 [Atopobiaceae bacterium]|nr:hypothetical protein [Atopobiaceae bacterium]